MSWTHYQVLRLVGVGKKQEPDVSQGWIRFPRAWNIEGQYLVMQGCTRQSDWIGHTIKVMLHKSHGVIHFTCSHLSNTRTEARNW